MWKLVCPFREGGWHSYIYATLWEIHIRADIVGGGVCEWVKSCPAILMWECEMPSMLHRLIMAEDFQRISNKFYTGLASMPEWRVSFWQAKSKFQTMHHHHHHHQSPFISEVSLWHIAVTYFVLSEHGNSSIFGQKNEAMMDQRYQNLVKNWSTLRIIFNKK